MKAGTVIDLAHVVAVAPPPGATEAVAARGRAETGSFFDEVPTEAHDVFMDRVITEEAVYHGRGRRQP